MIGLADIDEQPLIIQELRLRIGKPLLPIYTGTSIRQPFRSRSQLTVLKAVWPSRQQAWCLIYGSCRGEQAVWRDSMIRYYEVSSSAVPRASLLFLHLRPERYSYSLDDTVESNPNKSQVYILDHE